MPLLRCLLPLLTGLLLVEQLGGKPVPAVGFAMGLERLVAVLEEVNPDAAGDTVDLYLVLMGDAASREGLVLAEQVRHALPDLQLVTHCGGGGMKAQFKRADRSGARFALVIGDSELQAGSVVVKTSLDETSVQLAEIRTGLSETKTSLDAVAKAKPAGAKGAYMKKIAISSTMGPGVTVDQSTISY